MRAAVEWFASRAWWAALAAVVVVIPGASRSATTQYQYDALGRLRQVIHDNSITTSYTLDPAGNRVQVADTPPAAPSAPPSIFVPSSSSTSQVVVSWGQASGVVTAYELYESATSSFSSQTLAYSGTSTILALARPNGTYWYRVRACRVTSCSAYATGANAVVVNIPPPAPPPPTGLSYSLIATCVWQARWNAVVGAAGYRFNDTVGNERTVAGTSTTVTCPFNNPNGNKPRWVKACNATGQCSDKAYF
jgi:YD repeat-containing protein